jgi:hypothetical protein
VLDWGITGSERCGRGDLKHPEEGSRGGGHGISGATETAAGLIKGGGEGGD